MDALKSPRTGSMTPSLLAFIVLLLLSLLICTRLRESALMMEHNVH
jgi:hypothetical protein